MKKIIELCILQIHRLETHFFLKSIDYFKPVYVYKLNYVLKNI